MMFGWYKNYTGYVREGYTNLTYPIRPKLKPKVKFVIFTVGRSGSGLLVNLLQSHSHIHCDDELFQRKLVSPFRYLRLKEQLSRKEVYGFKLNTYHFRVQKVAQPIEFVSGIHQMGYKIINLKRRNLLRQALSHMYALHRNKFHHKATQGKQTYDKFVVNLDKLQEELRLFESYRALRDKILEHIPSLQLVYEDDLWDSAMHQLTVDKVSDFIGIPSSRVQTDLRKTTPKVLLNFVENFDEVRAFLSNTKYAEFLEME